MSRKTLLSVVVLLGVAVVVLIAALSEREAPPQAPPTEAPEEEIGPGVQSVTLVFGDWSASRTVSEEREIRVPADKAGRLRRIVEALAEGPRERGAARTIPQGTVVRGAFFDDTGAVYIDFSREFVANHPGGSTGELFTIRSIVQTVVANFPEVDRVGILVEGEEVETIAGHIDASVPFRVSDYR